MKILLQPAAATIRNGKCPMHDCIALIVLAWQTRQVKAAIEIWFSHTGMRASRKGVEESIFFAQHRSNSCLIVAADVRRLMLNRGSFIPEFEFHVSSKEFEVSLLTSAATGWVEWFFK